MTSTQTDVNTSNTKNSPVVVTDWNDLIRYIQFLCRNTDKFKICMIDEEQEEIRIENKVEFDTNVKYAQDHGLQSLTLVVYINDVHKFDGIYHLEKTNPFPLDKLQNLREHVLVDKWYIPVKSDEALGVCLAAAIKLAQENKLEANTDCKQFIETIVPVAFRKLQTSQSVFSWPREIQYGIFDMIELLIDLVGTRLRYTPVPITLLNTLAIAFDTNTTFSQKHKDEEMPINRSYKLEDDQFLEINLNNPNESFGWIRSFIQRFIAQNGLKNLRAQFEYINNSQSTTTAMEYNSLLKLFSKCHKCIEPQHFRLLFSRPIRQAIQYFLETKKTNHGTNEQLNELNETLIEICFNYELNDEVNEILEIPTVPKTNETPLLPVPIVPLQTNQIILPLQKLSLNKKSKNKDCYEKLSEDIRSLTMNNNDTERKNIKKQRTEELIKLPVVSLNHLTDGTTDDLLSSSEKRSLKRKHRREQQRHLNKKENKRSNAVTTTKTYDRSDPADILRFFAPMKRKIAALYDDLQTATCHGNLREVLKIEEKLKLLRPYSARFIADENTPDGTSMQNGQVFRKGWILLNDGSMPWSNDDIQLINLSDGIKIVQQPVIPVTAPHDRTVITVDFMCADEEGVYESKWILSYRNRTFGPMFWCSIKVGDTVAEKTPVVEVKETFEFVDVPLPACFDLSKPYQSTSNSASTRSSFTSTRSNSTVTQTEPLIDNLESSSVSDDDSLSPYMYTPAPILPKSSETPLIELTPALPYHNEQNPQSPRLDFVDSVVTNIFSVAKQAGSTAKAIFNTLQANDETSASTQHHHQQQQQVLINTAHTSVDDFFEHVEHESIRNNSILSNDPMEILIEMGFANRKKNQRLLSENNNDLNKVIELLTNDTNEEADWLRLNSLLATYGLKRDNKGQIVNSFQRLQYPPLRQRNERERPRSIKFKPQEYFLLVIAFIAILSLVIYNLFMSYYKYYSSSDYD